MCDFLSPCLSNAWFGCFQYVVDDRSFALSVSVLPKHQLYGTFFRISGIGSGSLLFVPFFISHPHHVLVLEH